MENRGVLKTINGNFYIFLCCPKSYSFDNFNFLVPD